MLHSNRPHICIWLSNVWHRLLVLCTYGIPFLCTDYTVPSPFHNPQHTFLQLNMGILHHNLQKYIQEFLYGQGKYNAEIFSKLVKYTVFFQTFPQSNAELVHIGACFVTL